MGKGKDEAMQMSGGTFYIYILETHTLREKSAASGCL